MIAETMTADEIRARGLEALRRELGVAGMVRFLQQFETGTGDYTEERHELLRNESLEDILARISARRDQA